MKGDEIARWCGLVGRVWPPSRWAKLLRATIKISPQLTTDQVEAATQSCLLSTQTSKTSLPHKGPRSSLSYYRNLPPFSKRSTANELANLPLSRPLLQWFSYSLTSSHILCPNRLFAPTCTFPFTLLYPRNGLLLPIQLRISPRRHVSSVQRGPELLRRSPRPG